MKILCLLTGFAINEKKWDDPQFSRERALANIKKGKAHLDNIFENNHVDYFCHVWGTRSSDFIIKNYCPKAIICEDQKSFQESFYENYFHIFSSMPRMGSPFVGMTKPYQIQDSWSYFSAVYSQLHSRSYISQYLLDLHNSSRLNLCDYDLILLTRYDISSRGGFNVSNIPNLNSIHSSCKHQNKEVIILPIFNQLNDGYPDMWYLSNNHHFLNNISKQAILWRESILSDSEYFFLRENGWPLSEFFDLDNQNDSRQFSNRHLSKNNSTCKLMKYPRYHNLNIHAFVKYSFWIDPKLFRQTQFINIKQA